MVDAQAPQVLLCEQVLPLAAPALLQRLPPLREPADLAQAPLLRTPLEPWAPWFRAAGWTGPSPRRAPGCVDLGLTLEAAVSGQGVALARPSLARHWLAAGSLVPLFAPSAPGRRSTTTCCRSGQRPRGCRPSPTGCTRYADAAAGRGRAQNFRAAA